MDYIFQFSAVENFGYQWGASSLIRKIIIARFWCDGYEGVGDA